MSYRQRIDDLIRQVPTSLVNMGLERKPARIPTQASSEFTTNREQGDWAENILLTAINRTARQHVAVRYGKSDDRVAGEAGFAEFYAEFQQELDTIGKRPDILVFRRGDVPAEWGTDISRRLPAELDEVVGRALVGLEVRSSAFLSAKYEAAMTARTQRNIALALSIKAEIQRDYADLLDHVARQPYAMILNSITTATLGAIDFRVPSWRGSPALTKLSALFRQLKDALQELKKRDFLSITPKVEDLKVVYRWTQCYNVPHFYVQVFFDRAYALSYEHILHLLTNPDNEDVLFFTEADVKNQNKTTIKINPKEGRELAGRVEEPRHESRRKELERGRLLYYVAFEAGAAHLNLDSLAALLNIPTTDL